MEPSRPSGPSNRPTVVVIETFDSPRPTSTRIAAAFARAQLADVLVCHWHNLNLLPAAVLVSQGTRYVLTDDELISAFPFHGAVQVTALFFFAPNSGLITEVDREHMRRLGLFGRCVAERTCFAVVDNMLWKASLRGVATNAIGPDRRWGPKHEQEFKLRRYEMATGKIVARPNTYIASPSLLSRLLDLFVSRGQICIVKPVYGDGGSGITIVDPTKRMPGVIRAQNTVIVQNLLWHPLLIAGQKADLRCYLLLDVRNKSCSGRHGPIFVRRAPALYKRGILESEITNTAYRQRKGLLPDILPLDQVPSIRSELRTAITSQLTLLLRELTAAYFFVTGQVL